MKRFDWKVFGVALFHLAAAARADLTLRDTLQQVLKNHPTVEAEKYREEAGREAVRQAESGYYPQVDAEGIVSTGFPGSTGALGITGVAGSPYRKGPAAGLVLQQNIYDFGRTSGEVSVAEKRLVRDRAADRVEQTQLALSAVDAYYACAKDRSLAAFYHSLVADARQVEKEVGRYVKSGQRSIVERYLSEAQSEEATTAAADYQRRWELDRTRLGVLIGSPGQVAECADLAASLQERLPASVASPVSPFTWRAQSEIAISESERARARAGYFPKIVGIASAGYLDQTQLGVPMQNYSVGLGVVIPVFEGFKTSAEVSRYGAQTLQRQKEADAVARQLAESNAEFDRLIESARLRTEHLDHETKLARGAFDVAKERYFSQAGSLVDLRESVANLLRTQAQQKEAMAEMLTKIAEKSLVNGTYPLTP